MAGARNSASRLGVTLQGYHQVIALSQGNINESLEYHFISKPALCTFDVQLQNDYSESLKGTIRPPKVELVDVENADRALYVLQFAKGTYTYWDSDNSNKRTEVKIDAKGWQLAFYADFSLKKMASVPDKIAKAIQNPGIYSVDQLVIDFGTAEYLEFNWEKSRITGFKSKGTAAQGSINQFVSKWLAQLKAADSTGSHNILAYAVRVDAEKAKLPLQDALKKANPQAPSFPPTSVRLQTINYRPNGDASKTETDHDYNAFLFTEMTGGTKMITKDLAWSGDLFYESIGGSLIMSRDIFWEQFLKKKLKEVFDRNHEVVAKAFFESAMKQYKARGHVDYGKNEDNGTWIEEGDRCTKTCQLTFNSWKHFEITSRDDRGWKSPSSQDQKDDTAWTRFKMYDTIMQPQAGQNVLDVWHEVSLTSRWEKDGVEDTRPRGMAEWTDRLSLKSVADSGVLTMEYQTDFPKTRPLDTSGEQRRFRDLDILWDYLVEYKYSLDIKTAVESALNQQGHFIFPGGGDFEMKDPIFNNAGDLMIGLTYKKGDAAK